MLAPGSSSWDEVTRARALVALHEALGEVEQEGYRVLEVAARHIAALLDGATALWSREGQSVSLRAYSHPDPAVVADMDALFGGLEHPLSPALGEALAAGHEIRLTAAEVAQVAPTLNEAYQRFLLGREGGAGLVMVPLMSRGEQVGSVGITRDGGKDPLDEQDLQYLRQVARVVALALANARLLDDVALAQRRAVALAREDELTGLLNRRGFLDLLRTRLATPGRARLVAVLDMDGFKLVNDGFGHTAGDVVLTSVAARLCSALPMTTPVARIGGDEFAVFVEADDEEQCARRVEACVQAVSGAITVVGLAVPLTVSVGTSVPTDDADQALHQADLAMYRAKRRGGVVAAYDAKLDDPATRQLKEVMALRRSIAGGDLVVHYQPVVPVGEGPARVEALVRRRVGDHLQAPNGWLDMADRAGLMPELTEEVLGQVVDQLAAWWASGLEVECAVNIPASVLTSEVVRDLLTRLDKAELPRRALSVEVTEGDLVGAQAKAALARCADAQIAVAVDDFGTGWSALSYLVDLPLRTLKIDRTFVDGIDLDSRRAAIVRAVVEVAHELGLRVVAEGVETAAVADTVIDLGADALQGYYYARPSGPVEVEALLRAGLVAARS